MTIWEMLVVFLGAVIGGLLSIVAASAVVINVYKYLMN